MSPLSAILIILSVVMGLCFGRVVDGADTGWWIGLFVSFTALAVTSRMQARSNRAG